MCNVVAAVEGDLKVVYTLTPERIATIAAALHRAGFKPALHANAAK